MTARSALARTEYIEDCSHDGQVGAGKDRVHRVYTGRARSRRLGLDVRHHDVQSRAFR